jgi:hypothetical protein
MTDVETGFSLFLGWKDGKFRGRPVGQSEADFGEGEASAESCCRGERKAEGFWVGRCIAGPAPAGAEGWNGRRRRASREDL